MNDDDADLKKDDDLETRKARWKKEIADARLVIARADLAVAASKIRHFQPKFRDLELIHKTFISFDDPFKIPPIVVWLPPEYEQTDAP